MPKAIYLGFDFGMKRIGVAVGQKLTGTASPLSTLKASQGLPPWGDVQTLIQQWAPCALIVGLPTCMNDKALYTTKRAQHFARSLEKQFGLPVFLIDERLSTKEARSHLFDAGGYRKIKQSEVDSIAACIILERWLQEQTE